jgi:hypothetical protein
MCLTKALNLCEYMEDYCCVNIELLILFDKTIPILVFYLADYFLNILPVHHPSVKLYYFIFKEN